MLEVLETIPPDPILTLSEHFIKEVNPKKIDLGIGLYKDISNKTPIMECVKIAEKRLLTTYLPIKYTKDLVDLIAFVK